MCICISSWIIFVCQQDGPCGPSPKIIANYNLEFIYWLPTTIALDRRCLIFKLKNRYFVFYVYLFYLDSNYYTMTLAGVDVLFIDRLSRSLSREFALEGEYGIPDLSDKTVDQDADLAGKSIWKHWSEFFRVTFFYCLLVDNVRLSTAGLSSAMKRLADGISGSNLLHI